MFHRNEIVFIDPNVADLLGLQLGMRPEVDVILLTGTEPAPAQIAAHLRDRNSLVAVHIVAHGRPGEVSFAAGALTLDAIAAHETDLAAIGRALAADGQMRLWSCATAQGAAGHRFIAALERASGAEIAAATGLVGAAALGGNWLLDDLSSAPPLTIDGAMRYAGVMAAKSWDGGGTNDNWSNATNWNNNTLPATGDDITISASSTTVTYDITSNPPSFNSLTLSDSSSSGSGLILSVGTNTLNVNNSATSGISLSGNDDGVTVTLAGGTINVGSSGTGNISFGGSNDTLSGQGTVNGNLTRSGGTGSGVITATGGTLEINGTVGVSGTPIGTLSIGSGAGDDLQLDKASFATSVTFVSTSSGHGTLEISSGGSLTVTNAMTVGTNTIMLDGGTAVLTDSASSPAVTLSSGTITGAGKIAATVSVSGAGHITANGGTLEMASAITNTGTLALSVTGASDTLLLDAATAATSLSFGSTGTLEINTAGSLTLAGALAMGGGTVKLDGAASALTDNAGISLAAGTITGLGKVTGAISDSGAGQITAAGGTLEIASAITNSGTLALTVTGAGDKLLLDAASAATSLSFGSTGTLEINTAGSLTLANALAIGGGTVKLDGAASALTDNAGISLTTGTITGLGKVTGAISDSGAGHITAAGGTLEIAGAITNTGTLALTVTGASDKLLLDAASAATSLSFGSTGTLEINTAGSLTLANALAIGGATVKLDGAASALSDSAGISLSTGTISGLGTVTGAISASGAAHITATGGTLEIAGAITNTGTLALTVTGASDKLLLDAASAATSVAFGSTGTLEVNTAGSLSVANALAIGGATVKLDGAGTTQLADANGITLAGGTLTGTGTVAAGTNISGLGTVGIDITSGGTITASGGTLDMVGDVSGRTLAIATGSASDLKIDGTTSAAALSITNALQTLEVGATGALTLTSAQTVSLGKIAMSGGTLTDASGIVLGSSTNGATLTGFGTVNANVTRGGTATTNTISAAGGKLEINGLIASAGTPMGVLTVGSGLTDDLLLDGASFAASATFASATGHGTLEINTAGALTVTGASAVAVGTNTIQLDGAGTTQLTTGTGGITLGSGSTGGTITGTGTVAANTNISGFGTVGIDISSIGTITATAGTLDVTGDITNRTLVITTTSASDLKIDGTTTAAALSLAASTQTLEVGATGNLTLTGAQNVTLATIKMSGGTLSDSSGITLSTGTNSGTVSGFGTVNANLTRAGSAGTGTISAAGGKLEINGTIGVSATPVGTLTVGSGLTDDLLLDGASFAASATFASATGHGTLEINTAGALTITGASAVAVGTNTIQLDGAGTTQLTTGTGGITLGSGSTGGAITGTGTVAANTNISGLGTIGIDIANAGTITATGGTLDLTGDVSGRTLAISAVAPASDLKIDGTTSAAALSITTALQTLEVGATGALTLTSAQTVSLGTIKMSGGTLTDGSGIALGSSTNSATLTGFGTVNANVTRGGTATTNTISASGGTLEINGLVASAGTPMGVLTVGSALTDDLLLDGASFAASATFASATGHGTLEINTAGALTVTNAIAVGTNTIQLDGAGTTQLTDAAGITLGSGATGGTLTGTGTVAANTNISGLGTVGINIANIGSITATAGTLDVTGNVSGRTLAISSGSASDLKIDGTTTAAALSITNANQTLEVGGTGALTLTGAQTVSLGKIAMSGGTLADSSGIVLGTSTNAGFLTGFGTVSAGITKGGTATTSTITASGGTLDLTGTIGSGLVAAIATASASDLKIDGTATFASIPINNANQTLEIGAAGNLTLTAAESITNGTIQLDGGTLGDTNGSGITIGNGATLTGAGTVTGALTGSGTGVIQASGGTLNLNGTVTGGAALQIDTIAGSDLKINATATTTAAITLNNANQTLEIGSGGTLSIGAAETTTGGTIMLDGGVLDVTGAGGLNNGGTITGTGTLKSSGGGNIANSGLISVGAGVLTTTNSSIVNLGGGSITIASGGTLSNTHVGGYLENEGGSIAVGSGTLLTTSAIGIINASGTITVAGGTVSAATTGGIQNNAAGSISGYGTLTGAVVNGGLIAVTGGNITANTGVTNTGSITIASGDTFSSTGTIANNAPGTITLAGGTLSGSSITDSGTISGFGAITGALSGSGTVEASGGVLDLTSAITTATAFKVDTAANSVLEVDSTVGASSTLTFVGTAGTIELTNLAGFSGKIAGLAVGSTTTPANDIDIKNLTFTSATLSGTTIALFNGASQVGTLTLTSTPAAGAYALVQTDNVLGGKDVFLSNAAPTATWSPGTETGLESTSIALGTITPSTNDGIQSITIAGAPANAIITDGTNHHTFSGPSDAFDFHSWNLANLSITPVGDTNFTLSVTVKDLAGNTSTAATEVVTVNPSAPTVSPVAASGVEHAAIALNFGVAVTGQTGDSNTLSTLNISGAAANAVLTDGTNSHTFSGPSDVFDIHGWNLANLSITPATAANFTLTVAATETDADTNLSTTTTNTAHVTVAPGAPVISGIAPDTGIGNGDGLTDSATVSVSGTADANTTINLYDGVTLAGSTTSDLSGNWTIANVALTEGANSLTATATDADNDTSAASAPYAATLDDIAPTANSQGSVTDAPDSDRPPALQPETINVAFSETVYVGGSGAPQLFLTDGNIATYSGGSGTGTLSFSYTPDARDAGVTIDHFDLNGATVQDAAGNDAAISLNGDSICFMPGTLIRTQAGEVAVETLAIGDLVTTSDGGAAPVRWIGRQTVSRIFADPIRTLPIRVAAGALGETVPARDLLISPCHALLVDDVLVQAGALVNGTTITRETQVPQTFVYYHVELDDHALILAEGVPAETFIDNVDRMAFDNWAEHVALYPHGCAIVEMPYPRAKSARQVPYAIRARLAQRGERAGARTEAAA